MLKTLAGLRNGLIISILFGVVLILVADQLHGQLNISGNPPLPVAYGGTGSSVLSVANGVLFGNAGGTQTTQSNNFLFNSANGFVTIGPPTASLAGVRLMLSENTDNTVLLNMRFASNLVDGAFIAEDFTGPDNTALDRILSMRCDSPSTNCPHTNGFDIVMSTLSFGGSLTEGFRVTGQAVPVAIAPKWGTSTNCADSAGAAACGTAAAGAFVIDATATTVVVSTTAVTANSEIFVQNDSSLNSRLGITCNTQSSLVLGTPRVTARTAATSFTVTIEVGPTTNPLCLEYHIIN